MSEVRGKDMEFFNKRKKKEEDTVEENRGDRIREEDIKGDRECVHQRPKCIDEVPEEERGEYLDGLMNTLLILSKECRQVAENFINTVDDLPHLPRGGKDEGLKHMFSNLGSKLIPLLDHFGPFYQGNDRCTDQSKKEEIDKEMKHWQDLISLCNAKLEIYLAASYAYMPKVYAIVRKLKKTEDVEKVVEYLAIVDDDDVKNGVWYELEKCEENFVEDGEELEDTEESFEDVMEKVKVVALDNLDVCSTERYVHNVQNIARTISKDLGNMLKKF